MPDHPKEFTVQQFAVVCQYKTGTKCAVVKSWHAFSFPLSRLEGLYKDPIGGRPVENPSNQFSNFPSLNTNIF